MLPRKLADLIRKMPLTEGENRTAVPYLSVYRFSTDNIIMPNEGSPYLYFIAGGSMRLHTPSGIMDYVEGQFSVSSIDTPFCGEVLTRSAHADFLAVCVGFTAEEVISVVLELEDGLAERILCGEAVSAKAEASIASCLCKLFGICGERDLLAFMSAQIKREILFYTLLSACGRQFLQSIIGISHAGEIYEANTWIKRNFRENFTVETLAKERHMSVSSFHQKFKNAVGMGPLQCQKRLRLTEARRQMLNESVAVTDAAMDVGYESVSQFIRDYKKMFGASPKDDILSLRRQMKVEP